MLSQEELIHLMSDSPSNTPYDIGWNMLIVYVLKNKDKEEFSLIKCYESNSLLNNNADSTVIGWNDALFRILNGPTTEDTLQERIFNNIYNKQVLKMLKEYKQNKQIDWAKLLINSEHNDKLIEYFDLEYVNESCMKTDLSNNTITPTSFGKNIFTTSQPKTKLYVNSSSATSAVQAIPYSYNNTGMYIGHSSKTTSGINEGLIQN